MMTALEERDKRALESPWSRLDRLFDEWMRTMPMRRLLGEAPGEDLIRIDEYREDGVLVVKAEMPGLDPDKDVELTVTDHVLHIAAQRREEEKTEEKGYVRFTTPAPA